MLPRLAVNAPSRQPPPPGSARLVLAVVAVAGALGLLAILRHEWWRDEAYTWLIIRASTSPADMLERLGFNGHPRAYYLLAYALYHLDPSPLALSISNLAFALLAIALLVRSAPFPPLHKALFAVGFFPLYQYGVIARSYSLFLFLLFLYVHLKVRRPSLLAARLVCLALLAQVHLMSLGMACVLAFLELLEHRAAPEPLSAGTKAALVAFVLGILAAVYQILPRGPGSAVHGAGFGAFLGPGNGYLPPFDRLGGPLQVAAGVALSVLSILVLRDDRQALLRYGLLASPLFAISVVIYGGYRWHHGFYFISFVVALWLCMGPSARALRFLGAVLGLHAAVGAYAIVEDLRGPYSDGEVAARAVQAGGYGNLPVVGVSVRTNDRGGLRYAFEVDYIQPFLLYAPQGRAYDPRAGTFERYWRHYAEPHYFADMDAAELSARLTQIAARVGSPVLVAAVEQDLPEGTDPAPPFLRPIQRFPRALDYGERLSMYLFSPPD